MRSLHPLLVGAACAGLLAAPAAARTVDRAAVAGPAFAGDSVVWGEELADGSSRIVRWSAGSRPEVAHRFRAARKPANEIRFSRLPGALTASSARMAWGIDQVFRRRKTQAETVFSSRSWAYGSLLGGRNAPLLADCVGAYVTTAVEGDTVALGTSGETCADTPSGTRVRLIDGDDAPRLVQTLRDDVWIGQIRLAGPWVAWLEDFERIVVADRRSLQVVATLRARDVGGGSGFSRFDLDADGTIAVSVADRGSCGKLRCIRWLTLTDRRPHTIARRAWSTVELAGGRIAYERPRRGGGTDLMLAPLDGGDARRLDRLSRREKLSGEVALERNRVAWSVRPVGAPRGTLGELHVRALR